MFVVSFIMIFLSWRYTNI